MGPDEGQSQRVVRPDRETGRTKCGTNRGGSTMEVGYFQGCMATMEGVLG